MSADCPTLDLGTFYTLKREQLAAHVVEEDVDPGRAELAEPPGQVLRLVVHRAVEPSEMSAAEARLGAIHAVA
jgi:hypothetical protein